MRDFVMFARAHRSSLVVGRADTLSLLPKAIPIFLY